MAKEERFNVVGLRASVDAGVSDEPGSGRNARYAAGMPHGAASEERDSLREYLSVIARHRLVVLLCAVLTPLVALVYSLQQQAEYEASAAVLVNTGGAGAILSELPGIATTADPERLAATHVSLARLPVVARNTVAAVGVSESAQKFLGHSAVSVDADTDILRFIVFDTDPERAEALATAYARQFTRYRNDLDLEAIRSTRATISQTISKLEAQGQGRSALHAELVRALERLNAAEAVRGSAAVVVQPASGAVQVGPRIKRNTAIGLVLGLLYGIGLAFLIERLDTRVRTPSQVEAVVGLPVLGEIPKPPSLAKHRRKVAMLEAPAGPYAESVRKLRANLEFASLDHELQVLMVTSPIPGDGKSTVAADLAVAFARSGKRVALCDLDARDPGLARSFGIDGRRGLVDIALGTESLERALLSIPLPTAPGSQSPASASRAPRDDDGLDGLIVGQSRVGFLHLLPFGSRRPYDPGDFVNSETVRSVLASLRETHELVVVDTAPLLPVSDSRVVSEYVDGALVVCSIGRSSKPDLRKARRILSVLPTRVYGIAVTGAPATPGYGMYGAAYEASGAVDPAPRT